MPPLLRRLIKNSRNGDSALSRLETELSKLYREYEPNTGTTQAVDIVSGGVKSNALPERAYAIVNHRIADYSSVEALKARFESIVAPIAVQYNLSADIFGHLTDTFNGVKEAGHLTLSDAFGTALDPAPVTPTADSGPWMLLFQSACGTCTKPRCVSFTDMHMSLTNIPFR